MGVDLNRNYGYNWGLNNTGSSPNTSDETYRGTAPFSEPETRAIKWFCEQHGFRIAMNYHSFGNYLIYPWGYQQTPLTPDSSVFIAFAGQMTDQNNYVFGTGFETVGYATNGDSDDWMYGELVSKPKILSMTPEVGNQGDGFWPVTSRIEPLAEENVLPNLLTAHLAGNYLSLEDLSSPYLSSLSGTIDLRLTRLGLDYTGVNSIELVPVTGNIFSADPPLPLPALQHLQHEDVSLNYQLMPGVSPGDLVEFDAVVTMNGYSYTERLSKVYGSPTVVYSEGGDALANFDTSTAWALTDEDYFSASQSITDSPEANYAPVTTSDLRYGRIIDLRSALFGQLTFHAKWGIEAGWDYCQIQASPVGQENWQPLCARYTRPGTEFQDEGAPVWDGFSDDWVLEEVDLADYIGQRIEVRLRLVSDLFVEYDGFYMDDFEFRVLLDENNPLSLDTGFVDTVGFTGNPTGITSLSQAVRIYPNPARDMLWIENHTGQPLSLSLYTLSGQEVKRAFRYTGRQWSLDGVAPGAYVLNIRSDGRQWHERIIVSGP